MYAGDESRPFTVGRRFGEGDVVGCGIVVNPNPRLGRDPAATHASGTTRTRAESSTMRWFEVISLLGRLQAQYERPPLESTWQLLCTQFAEVWNEYIAAPRDLYASVVRSRRRKEALRQKQEAEGGQPEPLRQESLEAWAMSWAEWRAAILKMAIRTNDFELREKVLGLVTEREADLRPQLGSKEGVIRATRRLLVLAKLRGELERQKRDKDPRAALRAGESTLVLASIFLASNGQPHEFVPPTATSEGDAGSSQEQSGAATGPTNAAEEQTKAEGPAGTAVRQGGAAMRQGAVESQPSATTGSRGDAEKQTGAAETQADLDGQAGAAAGGQAGEGEEDSAAAAVRRYLGLDRTFKHVEGEEEIMEMDAEDVEGPWDIGPAPYAFRELGYSIWNTLRQSSFVRTGPLSSPEDVWSRIKRMAFAAARLAQRVEAVAYWPSAAAEEALCRPMDAEEQDVMFMLQLPELDNLCGDRFDQLYALCTPHKCCMDPGLEGARNAAMGCAFPCHSINVFFTCNGTLVGACSRCASRTGIGSYAPLSPPHSVLLT